MKKKLVWKIGDTARDIYVTLLQTVRKVKASPDLYLDDDFLRKLNIEKQDWDLAENDEFFACMEKEDFVNLKPTEPLESPPSYDDVEYPNAAPPEVIYDIERAASQTAEFFKTLLRRKSSDEGCGFFYSDSPSIWVPRELRQFERRTCQIGRPDHKTPIFYLSHAFSQQDKPHQVYYAWHGDEGEEGVVSRNELEILIRGIMGTMSVRKLCMHNVPVRPVSPLRVTPAHYDSRSYYSPSMASMPES